jgi:ATP-binding cassette subfamily B protein
VSAPQFESCLWPSAAREELAPRLAAAAALRGPVAATERFALAYRAVAPHFGAAALRRCAPAVLRAPDGALLALVAVVGGKARLLAPGGAVVARPAAELAAFLRAPVEQQADAGVTRVIARAALPAEHASTARAALLTAAVGAEMVAEGWRVRPSAPSLGAALRAAGLGRRLVLAAGAYMLQLVLLVIVWWMAATKGAGGRGVAPPLVTWAAALAALVVMRLASSWTAGRLAVDGGELLRARLLDGLLVLETEPIRADGVGRLLGRVMETEAVEALGLGGGLLALAGLFELATGAVVLALGASGARELVVLIVWIAVAVALAARFWRALRLWSERRLALTHDLVERMVGHRTLVAQQPPELRDAADDRALDQYARAGRALDRHAALLEVLVPRGWLIAGLAAVAPALASGSAAAGALAASLGGVLFTYGALRKLGQALPTLATAAVAWRQAAPLFAVSPSAVADLPAAGVPAPQQPESITTGGSSLRVPPPLRPPAVPATPKDEPLIAAREIAFHYPGRTDPVLTGCSLDIRRGDRVLIEGPSGGGKSTFGALLAGLRAPDTGALTLDGVPQSALGLSGWRARVGAAPQFHENHVFSASFLFNLLLGRRWPPTRDDVAEAEALCGELDLGPLLARMPSGLEQLVGESGWQLSHGERSRLFIARSLLQPLDARILDESFAALDPETLERTLACVLRRAETVVVIAHP